MELQCRLCLCNNSPLEAIVSTELEQLYYSLTLLPMKQLKPLLACYVCLAHLKKVYKIKMKFLLAANYFKSNKDAQQPTISHLSRILTVSVLQQDNIHPMLESRVASKDIIGEDNIKIEIKKEIEDEIESALDGDITNVGLNPDATNSYNDEACQSSVVSNTETKFNINDSLDNTFGSIADKKVKKKSLKSQKRQLKSPSITKQNRGLETLDCKTNASKYPRQCDVCYKYFPFPNKLKQHMRLHTGEKPFSCDLCQKDFSSRNAMKLHIESHYTKKSFICETCKKPFANLSQLTRHMRIHSGEKPYTCDTCKKSFSDKDTLKKHLIVHTREKPFKCDICKKSYQYNRSLKIHQRTHTGEKPYECDICDKKFSVRSNMVTHVYKNHMKHLV